MLNKFSNSLDFSGHNVYAGLDVHGSSWAVNIIVDDIEHRKFTQPPDPVVLYNYLSSHFPGANYFSAYECGFCGYHHHRKLLELGIKNIVINPADLPVTNKEKQNKTDPVDSRRLSNALKNNQIKGIYVFNPEHEQFRSLFRMRWRAAKENRRTKNRIRSFLHYFGIIPPVEVNAENWSLAFINWLNYQVKLPTESVTLSLKYLLKAYQTTREQLLDVTKQLRHQVKSFYPEIYKCLLTVPGIGPIVALCLIAEIGDIFRFKSYKHLASYVGFVPRSHQSGDKDPKGKLTYRSNKYLRSSLVEAAWTAMRYDPALLKYYKDRIAKYDSRIVIAKGIKPADHIRRGLMKEGFICSKNYFNKLLKNPVYYGKIRIAAKGVEEEKIVEGIHEPIISEELFFQVQNVIETRARRMKPAKIHKVNERFPLRGFMECPRCGSKLTASSSQGNGGKYYYYHCIRGCKERIKAGELNNSFVKLLKQYTFKSEVKDLFKKVVMDTLKGSLKDIDSRLQQIISETEKIKKRLESLQDKFIDNELSKEDYNLLKAKYTSDLDKLTKEKVEINFMTHDISDQLEFCIGILENLSGFYDKADVVGKQQIIGSIFTGNLIFSNNRVRTTKVNEVVSLLINSSKAFEKKKKGQLNKNMKLSPWVTPAGLVPLRFMIPPFLAKNSRKVLQGITRFARDPHIEGPTR